MNELESELEKLHQINFYTKRSFVLVDDLEKNISRVAVMIPSRNNYRNRLLVEWKDLTIQSNFLFFQKKKKYNQIISKLKDRNTLISAKLEELTIERDYLK